MNYERIVAVLVVVVARAAYFPPIKSILLVVYRTVQRMIGFTPLNEFTIGILKMISNDVGRYMILKLMLL